MVKVNAVGFDDRGDGVKKVQAVAAEALENVIGESVACQGACGYKSRTVALEARDFFAV